jgi:hypothetical protein
MSNEFNDKDFENFGKPAEDIPTADLDTALMEVKEADKEYKAKKAESSAAYATLEEKKAKLMNLMERAQKTRWEVDGVGGFTKYDELKWRIPDGPENKVAFFEFLKTDKVCEILQSSPEDVFVTYATVHSATLNKLCNMIKEEAAKNGEDVAIPGIRMPEAEPKLRALPKRK